MDGVVVLEEGLLESRRGRRARGDGGRVGWDGTRGLRRRGAVARRDVDDALGVPLSLLGQRPEPRAELPLLVARVLRVVEVRSGVVSNALGAVAEELGGVHELQELVVVAVELVEVGDVTLRELCDGGGRRDGARAHVGRVALLVAHRGVSVGARCGRGRGGGRYAL